LIKYKNVYYIITQTGHFLEIMSLIIGKKEPNFCLLYYVGPNCNPVEASYSVHKRIQELKLGGKVAEGANGGGVCGGGVPLPQGKGSG